MLVYKVADFNAAAALIAKQSHDAARFMPALTAVVGGDRHRICIDLAARLLYWAEQHTGRPGVYIRRFPLANARDTFHPLVQGRQDAYDKAIREDLHDLARAPAVRRGTLDAAGLTKLSTLDHLEARVAARRAAIRAVRRPWERISMLKRAEVRELPARVVLARFAELDAADAWVTERSRGAARLLPGLTAALDRDPLRTHRMYLDPDRGIVYWAEQLKRGSEPGIVQVEALYAKDAGEALAIEPLITNDYGLPEATRQAVQDDLGDLLRVATDHPPPPNSETPARLEHDLGRLEELVVLRHQLQPTVAQPSTADPAGLDLDPHRHAAALRIQAPDRVPQVGE